MKMQIIILGSLVALLAVASALNYRSQYKLGRQSIGDRKEENNFRILQRILSTRQGPAPWTRFRPAKLTILFNRFDATTPKNVVDEDDWVALSDVLASLSSKITDPQKKDLKQKFIELYQNYLAGNTGTVTDFINYVVSLSISELQDWNRDLCTPFFFAMDFDQDKQLEREEYVHVYNIFFQDGDLAEKVFTDMLIAAGKTVDDSLEYADYEAAGFDFFWDIKSSANQHIFGPISEEDLLATCS